MTHGSAQDPVDTLNQMVTAFSRRGLGHHVATDERLGGREVQVHGRSMLNFGSCSYLGLERHPALIAAAHDALDRYGTQFSSSRTFLALEAYEVLEARLRTMFEQPVLVSATTTLGHLATLPTLVREGDAVIMDLQVHSSVQMTAQLLKAQRIPIYILRHNAMDHLERRVRSLRTKYRRIWYFADGIYSMYGDGAPMDEIMRLLSTYEALHLYIDDAHGMSWAGPRGTGYVRQHAGHHPRMVLAVSLNKAFACAGGAVVLPNEELRTRIRNCGSTQLFSGPIQPVMLGAAIASADLHLSDSFASLQAELATLVEHTNRRMSEAGLPQVQECGSPVFFVPLGLPRLCANLCERLLREDLHVHMGIFPATPMRAGGLRFCINRNLRAEDIDRLVERVRHHYPLVLQEEGSSCAEVAKVFGLPEFHVAHSRKTPSVRPVRGGLQIERYASIDAIEPSFWDGMFAGRGNYSHAALRLLEHCFGSGEGREDSWSFHYVIVRDPAGAVVLATFFTEALVKDDMFAAGDVSRVLERRRADGDPYYLTSRAVLLGTPITSGEHLYLSREHSAWREALAMLLGEVRAVADTGRATHIYLREFTLGGDPELRSAMLDLGFVEAKLPDVCMIENADWNDPSGFMRRLSSRYRNDLRREVLRRADKFELVTGPLRSVSEVRVCYGLYQNVFERAFDLNVFRLPFKFFQAISCDPGYDVLRLVRRDDPARTPIAAMWSFVGPARYNALIIGLDYAHVASDDIYKQMLYRTVLRARELGATTIDLAYTATLAKKKVGARPYPRCAYVQLADHYSQAIMQAIDGTQTEAALLDDVAAGSPTTSVATHAAE